MTELIGLKEWTHEGRPLLNRRNPAPEGPWTHEPDKRQWVDPETDLDCLMVRNPFGAWCGYVGVGEDHPWFKKSYSGCTQEPACEDSFCEHSPETVIECHGGITFANSCDEEAKEGHGICHIPLPGRSDNVWWFGFDCAHFMDLSPTDYADEAANPGVDLWKVSTERGERYREVPYVEDQVRAMARQLLQVKEAR